MAKKSFDNGTRLAVTKLLFQFGQQIRSVRKQKDITQGEYGELLGLNPRQSCGQVSRLENGRLSPTLETMVFFARKLGLGIKVNFYVLDEEAPVLTAPKSEIKSEVAPKDEPVKAPAPKDEPVSKEPPPASKDEIKANEIPSNDTPINKSQNNPVEKKEIVSPNFKNNEIPNNDHGNINTNNS